MERYEKKILNLLLDSYEKSRLFSGENKVRVRIGFPFNRKTMPAYFEEGSLEYEEVHAHIQELEQKGFLSVEWQGGKIGHIIKKVYLAEDKIPEVYEYLDRTPKQSQQEEMRKMLTQAARQYQTPVCSAFVEHLLERLRRNRSVKEYVDISDLKSAGELVRTIWLIEKNEYPCYIREFSIRIFSDSKAFEAMEGGVTRVFHQFGDGFEGMALPDILAEYSIYQTPNYVYLKGNVTLDIDGEILKIDGLRQGIGVSGEDIARLSLLDAGGIKRILTIENLTTFFRWQEEGSLILYLGGYHNSVRRVLLKRIFEQLPLAEYLHFGDIDAGGFEIYEDLCRKTGIPFRLYRMDEETLKKYEKYGKRLTENDQKRIRRMLENRTLPYVKTLQYMLEKDIKLEQECIGMVK